MVVISQDELNKYLDTVVVCPLTTTIHPQWRSRIEVVCDNKPAEVAVDRIRSISKQRLVRKIDKLTPVEARKIRLLIAEMYGE